MMVFIIEDDYESMSRRAADELKQCIKDDPACTLGLATGSTPIGLYDCLVEDYDKGEISFKEVTTFNLDEYCGLEGTHEQSYRYFMNKHLFDRVDIDKANTHVPEGISSDPEAACEAYEDAIKRNGGIDLQLLGLGHNGHIGFNEPCDYFPKRTHEVKLTKSTIDANSRLFDSIDDVPKSAYTMGIGTIMAARKIVLIASGKDKAKIVWESMFGEVRPEVPASILQFHPNLVVVVDREAASELQQTAHSA